MADIDDIVDYIRALKKGYDKEIFKAQIQVLNNICEAVGLDYDDFHTLFKTWLNLPIPYTDWSKIGLCLVPRERVEARTVQLALRWLLANYNQCNNTFSRVALILDWLTAAMDTDSIDLKSLDLGYDIFISLLDFESLAPYALRLVYVLSKPGDVSRRRVLSLLQLARTRESKKSKMRQIYVVLNLFKSRKPEYVPETIPVVPVQSVFRNINRTLMDRFWKNQARRNMTTDGCLKLEWSNPINSKVRVRSKDCDQLIPNMEFVHVGSTQYSNEADKNYLDFTESSRLLAYSCEHTMSRPARLRAMFCNDTALALLSAANCDTHTFLSYDLHYLLQYCFFHSSHYSEIEKKHFLRRLAIFQNTLMQGVPVITKFLAQYIPVWNDREYFAEILLLLEWVSLDTTEHLTQIMKALMRYFYRFDSLEKCSVLNAVTQLYKNLAYSKTRAKLYFMDMEQSPTAYNVALTYLHDCIADMTNKALQVDPENSILLYLSLWTYERIARAELDVTPSIMVSPPNLVLSLPLLSPSAIVIDKFMLLLTLYQRMYKSIRKTSPNTHLDNQRNTLRAYTEDYIGALWEEEIFTLRSTGQIFKQLPELIKKKLLKIPNVNSSYNFGSHYAFAPYTYTQLVSSDCKENKLWFTHVVAPQFSNLSDFFSKC